MGSLRERVRAVVRESGIEPFALCDAWMRGHDPSFTAALAGAGLVGLSWPKRYGGGEATHVDRLAVTEELLRVGAPVAAHWIADRQLGPSIMRHGTEQLKQEFLPRIAAGEVTFCLGMSEPDSGSDLAKVRTKAVRDGGTFRITGGKIWTSHAHRSTHAYVLARTGGEGGDPHDGLTEFIVDMAADGVTVRPIVDLAGEHHFNEMIFDGAAASHVVGTVGQGWRQVTEQLAFERGGAERILSTYPLLARLLGTDAELVGEADLEAVGELVARLHTLRAMAHGVATAMDAGEAPVLQAAMLKYLGTAFEGDVVEEARRIFGASPAPGAPGFEGVLAGGILASPGATLRGGATEILLTIIGKAELPPAGRERPRAPRVEPRTEPRAELREVADEALSGATDTWALATELGWTGIGVDEKAGGSGGELADLAEIVTAMAFHARSAPVAETAVAGRALAAAGKAFDPARPVALALALDQSCTVENGRVSGRLRHVPWAGKDAGLLVVVQERLLYVEPGAPGMEIEAATNLAGEPCGTVVLDSAPCEELAGGPRVRHDLDVLRSAALLGAMEAAHAQAREHVRVREQFGRPLAAFQAVAHTVARMAAEVRAVRTAVGEAAGEDTGHRAAVARIIAARAAGTVARQAHQLLGAMGITEEHDLHLATRRLWAWRDEYGAARVLARDLGRAAVDAGEDAVWNWCVHETSTFGSES